MKSIKSTILPLKTILYSKKFIFGIFILLHIFLFNVNTAEWGDSYRILRASNFIRNFAYPADEKRPPLFSSFLALRPGNVDPVQWARGEVFIISFLYFVVFYLFAKKFFSNKKYLLLSCLLFIFNPVILYWSVRIMSDVLFGLLVLLSIFLLYLWKDRLDLGRLILLGFLTGASILTRFEGYMLFASICLSLLFEGKYKTSGKKSIALLWIYIKKNFLKIFIFILACLLTALPYLLYKNPFNSSYFDEPSGRAYDLKMVWTYFASLFFIFGFTPALFIIYRKPKAFLRFFIENKAAGAFTVLELVLILMWPAAIPRLFISILPFLIFALSLSIKDYYESGFHDDKIKYLLINLFILLIFIATEYFLKLQFLVPNKVIFALVVFLQLVLSLLIYFKRKLLFTIVLFLSVCVWSINTIWIHKDLYQAVKEASLYTKANLNGSVAFNDTTSVFDWYINYDHPGAGLRAFYLDGSLVKNKDDLKNAGYLLITNEDGIGVRYRVDDMPYLTLIKEFRYNISRTEFYARIYKVD